MGFSLSLLTTFSGFHLRVRESTKGHAVEPEAGEEVVSTYYLHQSVPDGSELSFVNRNARLGRSGCGD